MKKLGLIAFALAGCTTVESDNILTSGMYADLSARAGGDGTTHVSATLMLGNPINLDYVDLTGGDELRVEYDGEVQVMSELIVLGTVTHGANFQGDSEDDEFEIQFLREVDVGAPSSIVTLPAPFEIAPNVATRSRAASHDIAWDNSSPDSMRWSASGDCIDSAGANIGTDEGIVTITPSTLRKREGATVPDECEVTVTISRTRLGLLDTHFGEGGSVVGEQSRVYTFTSTP